MTSPLGQKFVAILARRFARDTRRRGAGVLPVHQAKATKQPGMKRPRYGQEFLIQGTRYLLILSAFLIAYLSIAARAALPPSASGTVEQFFQNTYNLAIDRSPELSIAKQAYQQKAAQSYSAWAHWLPRLELQLSNTRSRDYSFLNSGVLSSTLPFIGPLTPQEVHLSAWAIRASFPLFRRATWVAIEQSSDEKQLAESQWEMQRSDLEWKMRQLLGNYLLQTYKEATIENSIEIAKSNEREAQLRFELGQRTRVDVLRSKANLATLESQRLTYQQDQASGLNRFLELAGMTEEEVKQAGLFEFLQTEDRIAQFIDIFTDNEPVLKKLTPLLGASAEPGKVSNDQKQWIVQRLEQSSNHYRAIDREQAAAESRAKNVTAQEWPELSLQASLNKQAAEIDDLTKPENRSYSFGAVLTIPLFIGGSVVSTALEQHHAASAARLKRDLEVRKLRNELETEVLQARALMRTVESLRLVRLQKEEIERLSFKSYQLGKSTMVELLASQSELIDAKVSLAKAKLDLAVLLRRLSSQLGG